MSFDPVNGEMITVVSDAGEYTEKHGFFSNFSAALACMSNIGPGFEAVGPYTSYAEYSGFSQGNLIFLIFCYFFYYYIIKLIICDMTIC